ncbi:hypothetical protein LBMAG57_37550 [Verrucomicrobiota bacterium]|nr:hypothetical protein LBMAG57_37550 [Verrucomicrobiota bacterium]
MLHAYARWDRSESTYWENAGIRRETQDRKDIPPHSPTPIPGLTGLTVSGAAGEEAIAA